MWREKSRETRRACGTLPDYIGLAQVTGSTGRPGVTKGDRDQDLRVITPISAPAHRPPVLATGVPPGGVWASFQGSNRQAPLSSCMPGGRARVCDKHVNTRCVCVKTLGGGSRLGTAGAAHDAVSLPVGVFQVAPWAPLSHRSMRFAAASPPGGCRVPWFQGWDSRTALEGEMRGGKPLCSPSH